MRFLGSSLTTSADTSSLAIVFLFKDNTRRASFFRQKDASGVPKKVCVTRSKVANTAIDSSHFAFATSLTISAATTPPEIGGAAAAANSLPNKGPPTK